MKFVEWIQNISKDNLHQFDSFYSDEIFFQDPFNKLYSKDKVYKIYSEMLDKLENPKFDVLEIIGTDDNCFLVWNFKFKIFKSLFVIHGTSHLKFREDKIIYHRDYWDVGEEVLKKIPIIKWIYKKMFAKMSI